MSVKHVIILNYKGVAINSDVTNSDVTNSGITNSDVTNSDITNSDITLSGSVSDHQWLNSDIVNKVELVPVFSLYQLVRAGT